MPTTDEFSGFSVFDATIRAPASRAFAVTPHNVNELTTVSRALYIGVAGDVACILVGDTVAVTFKDVFGLLPARVKQVLATGTTATGILALL